MQAGKQSTYTYKASIYWVTEVLPQDLVKSRRREIRVLDFSNCSEIWQATRQQRFLDACPILERYDHYNIQSRGFETSRDLAVRRLTA